MLRTASLSILKQRFSSRLIIACAAALHCLAAAPVAAAAPPDDPLKSPMWADVTKKLLTEGPLVIDERIKITVPPVVENQAQVPVSADARGVPDVIKLVVFADLNPIQHVLTLTPGAAEPYISFRMKVEQGTPVRAAALTKDGTWHIASTYLDAAGGGCSSPALARQDVSWSETIGQMQGKIWRERDGSSRIRLRIRHPMDTGLAKDNTPAFFIERVDLLASSGAAVATIELFEPVSEDPALTLLAKLSSDAHHVFVDGRDNNGTRFEAAIPATDQQLSSSPSASPTQ